MLRRLLVPAIGLVFSCLAAAMEDNRPSVTDFLTSEHGNFLLKHFISAKDKNGYTVLFCAVKEINMKAITYLLDIGADVSTIDNNSLTVMHHAAELNFLEAAKLFYKKDPSLIHKLDNLNGGQPLYWAVKNNHADFTEWLCDNGADIKKVINGGRCIMHVAASHGALDAARILHKRDPSLIHELYGTTKCSCLHVAAENNQPEFISWLITCGADAKYCDTAGTNAFLKAVTQDYLQCAKNLLASRFSRSIELLKEHQQFEAVEQLKGLIPSIDHPSHYDNSELPIFRAVRNNALKCLEWLILQGANVNVRTNDCRKNTIFHIAADNKHHKAISCIKEAMIIKHQRDCATILLMCKKRKTQTPPPAEATIGALPKPIIKMIVSYLYHVAPINKLLAATNYYGKTAAQFETTNECRKALEPEPEN